MKKFNNLIVVVLIVAIAVFGAWFVWPKSAPAPQNQPSQTQTAEKIDVTADGKTVNYTGKDGQTALAVLQSLTQVTSEDSAYGKMVTGINGVTAEKNKTYWAFYVDGAYANEGAGTFITKNGQKLQWKLEAIQQ